MNPKRMPGRGRVKTSERMASINREQAQARIARDDGDSADEVHVLRGVSSEVGRYHEDSECRTLPTDRPLDTMLREHAQQHGNAPCLVCVLETTTDNPGQSLTAQLAAMSPEDAGLSPFPPRDE